MIEFKTTQHSLTGKQEAVDAADKALTEAVNAGWEIINLTVTSPTSDDYAQRIVTFKRILPLLTGDAPAAVVSLLPQKLVTAWNEYKRYTVRSDQWTAAFSDLAFVLQQLMDEHNAIEKASIRNAPATVPSDADVENERRSWGIFLGGFAMLLEDYLEKRDLESGRNDPEMFTTELAYTRMTDYLARHVRQYGYVKADSLIEIKTIPAPLVAAYHILRAVESGRYTGYTATTIEGIRRELIDLLGQSIPDEENSNV